MATYKVTNVTKGIRGFHSADGLVELNPGGVAEGVEISDAELKSAKRTEWFEIESGGGGHGDPDKGGKREAAPADDLDTTIPKLREIAEKEKVDLSGMTSKGDIQGAIRLARASKGDGAGSGEGSGNDAIDAMDDETLRSTVAAITGQSAEDVAGLDRPALLALARGQ